MATEKECKCIENITRSVIYASALGEIDKPDRIARYAKELDGELDKLEKNCVIDISASLGANLANKYNDGRNMLLVAKSTGDIGVGRHAGDIINDILQDATVGKLIQCKKARL